MKKQGVSRYEERGVSATKTDVHSAIACMDQGLFPGAFCTIHPDDLSGNRRYCNIQHADGVGTKLSLAFLVWRLTGNMQVWRNIVQDCFAMNTDDIGCVGVINKFLVSMTIGRNKALIPGEVIKTIIESCQDLCDQLSRMGMRCTYTGGETADVGDLTRTIIVDSTFTARPRRSDIIDASRIDAPALIVGFSSTGQAAWEDKPNSGIGSNGLTNARHDALAPIYRKFAVTYAPETRQSLVYCGKYRIDSLLPGDPRFTIGSALLSPTRIYLPLIKRLVDYVGRKAILGIIHCTGGGQTKIGKFGPKGIIYEKDSPFETPPLFRMLRDVRGLPWREMYQSYNMGSRLEVVVRSEKTAERCIAVADSCGIDAKIVGSVLHSQHDTERNRREVRIKDPSGTWHTYTFH